MKKRSRTDTVRMIWLWTSGQSAINERREARMLHLPLMYEWSQLLSKQYVWRDIWGELAMCLTMCLCYSSASEDLGCRRGDFSRKHYGSVELVSPSHSALITATHFSVFQLLFPSFSSSLVLLFVVSHFLTSLRPMFVLMDGLQRGAEGCESWHAACGPTMDAAGLDYNRCTTCSDGRLRLWSSLQS